MNLRKGCALLLVGALPAILAGCRGFGSRYINDEMSNSTTGASGEVVINKMGGGIDVANAPHGATLSTMGGGIHVGNVASFARIKTMGGGIDSRSCHRFGGCHDDGRRHYHQHVPKGP